MNKKKELRRQARALHEAAQARRVVNGIFIALVLLMLLGLLAYYLV